MSLKGYNRLMISKLRRILKENTRGLSLEEKAITTRHIMKQTNIKYKLGEAEKKTSYPVGKIIVTFDKIYNILSCHQTKPHGAMAVIIKKESLLEKEFYINYYE